MSRNGSSEYQLHLMKVSDRDRNVNKKLVLVVFLVKFIIKESRNFFVRCSFSLVFLPSDARSTGRGISVR